MRNWEKDLEPILTKYGKLKHPLDYKNRYQLIVVVILSARDNDNHINKISPEFFKPFPSFSELKNHKPEDLYPLISSVRSFRKKAEWLIEIAKSVGDDSSIPHSIEGLTKLPGIGRKTANVIIRESGDNAEGVVVDLHVVRVAPRLGLADSIKPEKIESQIMNAVPQNRWNEAGMSLSFHGREICRPKPKCEICVLNPVCDYFQKIKETVS